MTNISIESKFQKAVLNLLECNYTLGVIASKFNAHLESKGENVIAYTNLRTIVLNKDYIEKLNFSTENIIFIIAHECLHIILKHKSRISGKYTRRNLYLWNIATDYAINSLLVENKIGEFPNVGLYDKKYKDMSSEQIYNIISENCDKNNITPEEFEKSMSPIKIDPTDPLEIGKLLRLRRNSNNNDNDVFDKISNVLSSSYSKDLLNKISRKFTITLSKSELNIEYFNLLKKYLVSKLKPFDYSFRRPAKKLLNYSVYTPAQISTKQTLNLFLGIDMSGSTDDFKDILCSEVVKILKDCQRFSKDINLTILEFTSIVEHHKTFKINNYFTIGDIKKYLMDYKEYKSYCTDIFSSFKFVEKQTKNKKNDKNIYICLTDGYDSFKDSDYENFKKYFDSLFFIYPNNLKFKSPANIPVIKY